MSSGANNQHSKLSTSALAKRMDISTQALFSTLKDYGWIKREENGWLLTGKGEFEGGEYVQSQRYGRYIVWPQELTEHRLFQAVEDNKTLTSTTIGKPFHLSARQVNRILSELGWIKHSFQGWELCFLGENVGGKQIENDSSGTLYVVWPDSVLDNPQLLERLKENEKIYHPIEASSPDLFEEDSEFVAPNGMRLDSHAALQVCHWLYQCGIAHAYNHPIPLALGTVNKDLKADFFLPAYHIYIDIWGHDDSGKSLSNRLQKAQLYKDQSMDAIELHVSDLENVDDVLTKALRKHNVRVI